MMDYFFRHYSPWVDHFFILDDGSTDGTLEYLSARNDVELGTLIHSDPDSWIISAKYINDNQWKNSRNIADWVVVTNIDEHLHHFNMRSYLEEALKLGVSAIPSLGYQMIATEKPDTDAVLWRDYPIGTPWKRMSKLSIFRPDYIEETNFSPGRHTAKLQGDIVYPERDEVINLHYKYIFGLEATQRRHEEQRIRLGNSDIKKNWGHKYHWSKQELSNDFTLFQQNLVDSREVDHHVTHLEPRWWR